MQCGLSSHELYFSFIAFYQVPITNRGTFMLHPNVVLGTYAFNLVWAEENGALVHHKSDNFAHEIAMSHLAVIGTSIFSFPGQKLKITLNLLAAAAGSIIQQYYHMISPSVLEDPIRKSSTAMMGLHLGCPRKPEWVSRVKPTTFCKCYAFFHVGVGLASANSDHELFPCRQGWKMVGGVWKMTCKCIKRKQHFGRKSKLDTTIPVLPEGHLCCFTSA